MFSEHPCERIDTTYGVIKVGPKLRPADLHTHADDGVRLIQRIDQKFLTGSGLSRKYDVAGRKKQIPDRFAANGRYPPRYQQP